MSRIDANFTSGYPGPLHLSAEDRARAKRDLDLRDVETALAAFCENRLGLELDSDLFPGSLPHDIRQGMSISVLPSDTGRSFNYWKGRVFISCRSADRSWILEKCGSLLNGLPLADWLTVNSAMQKNAVTFCRITPVLSNSKTPVNCLGREGYFLEMEFEIKLCITPPEPAFS